MFKLIARLHPERYCQYPRTRIKYRDISLNRDPVLLVLLIVLLTINRSVGLKWLCLRRTIRYEVVVSLLWYILCVPKKTVRLCVYMTTELLFLLDHK